jgi:hypothetical protein
VVGVAEGIAADIYGVGDKTHLPSCEYRPHDMVSTPPVRGAMVFERQASAFWFFSSASRLTDRSSSALTAGCLPWVRLNSACAGSDYDRRGTFLHACARVCYVLAFSINLIRHPAGISADPAVTKPLDRQRRTIAKRDAF